MTKHFNITIDGESGTGKSTMAGMLAKKYDMLHLNTGATFRALAVNINRNKIDATSEKDVVKLLSKTDIKVKFTSGKQQTFLNGELLDAELYENSSSITAGMVARHQPVRDYLINIWRTIAKEYSVILDGRDCGSVVLPNADVKIFLTANIDSRTERRFKELEEKGKATTKDELKKELLERDINDRKGNGNLVKMPDTITVDSSGMSIIEVFNKLVEIINKRVK